MPFWIIVNIKIGKKKFGRNCNDAVLFLILILRETFSWSPRPSNIGFSKIDNSFTNSYYSNKCILVRLLWYFDPYFHRIKCLVRTSRSMNCWKKIFKNHRLINSRPESWNWSVETPSGSVDSMLIKPWSLGSFGPQWENEVLHWNLLRKSLKLSF